ncbi:MAG: type IV secretion system DNA-binding domain-containing protein [Acidobacteriota bacterium]|nr:type IV secretion system DNA-binding domain-containing protein [Acidobacteriota bacterium]
MVLSAGSARTAGVVRRRSRLVLAGLAASAAAVRALRAPFPAPGENPFLDLVGFHDPAIHAAVRVWYHAAPAVAVLLAGSLLISVWRVWFEPRVRSRGRGRLPSWPASPEDPEPSLVVGELHHPTVLREGERPSWLTIPEAGLYTGILVVGAVGSGKTSACMHPFATQILSWQAGRPDRRAAGLVLEVKGDFCHGVRRILEQAGRGEDYIEIGLGGSWQWNPLDDRMLDTYSLAYSVSTLINQLFGKSREPFWQQAYTNLVRWIIQLHRLLPGEWVTLRDVYRCTIDAELFARKIQEARDLAAEACPGEAVITREDLVAAAGALGKWRWESDPGAVKLRCRLDPELGERLAELGTPFEVAAPAAGAGSELREEVEAIERWYRNDWTVLDAKLRTSIVEGISVFLSLFDEPEVARVFCPPPPRPGEQMYMDRGRAAAGPRDVGEAAAAGPPLPGLRRRLPPLGELIESGKVLALNMPAGANPALGRAIGVLLKNAWMQALLRRPAAAARRPRRYMRPAAFICDEYQAFATVGQDDPGGDEKAFALTRQCRCIPIVATQSISSLRSVLPGNDAWRTLVQTLRTRIFLSLSDESSARIASEMCGSVMRTQPSYTFSETTGRPEFSLLSGRPGGGRGTIGTSKSFRTSREPVFTPREFSLLDNCQAICLPYDGTRSLPARRVYLKPHYLPREKGYWRLREEGRL